MASRLVRSAVGAAALRPSLFRPAPISLTTVRNAASTPNSNSTPAAPKPTTTKTASEPVAASSSTVSTTQDPKQKAQSLIDSMPGNSLLSKSAILSSAAGASIYAISNEYYVVNEETVVAVCLLAVWGAIIKYGGPMYSEWAQAQNDRIRGILTQAREDHKQAVQTRINDVSQMSGVVEVTKSLFAVSKETAQLEAEAYELQQKTAIAAEAKAVLDSWVRYESQVKIRQQKELAESVIAKVTKELENPKVLQQILTQSVAEVEKIVSSKAQ